MGAPSGGRLGVERMKCVNGIWYHRGRSYTTLYEALAAVWSQVPPRRAGEKGSRPRYSEYRERQGKIYSRIMPPSV